MSISLHDGAKCDGAGADGIEPAALGWEAASTPFRYRSENRHIDPSGMHRSNPARCSRRDRLNEPFVTERMVGKFLEATRAPIVIEFSIRLKERPPSLPVTVLQCFDSALNDGIRERINPRQQRLRRPDGV